ncbi:leukocyte elastase inhibitor C isoform X3 [Odontomachus brunneus]|uniref:leukocyte elastase inhibitor C isoform X3 n=1 Tax=Odontomachus brunneus TaxID=486640 RepID=UPI0013F2226C|nr:leukocyte elastase inhibitor C isoform X3 [Odontomachus brunneus]
MARAWVLLFSLLALGHCQIIYPDQYEIMKAASNNNNGGVLNSNNQPTQQYNPQLATAAQAAPVRPLSTTPQAVYYPSTTITTPIPNPQPLPQDWSTHVNNIIARGITKFALHLDRAIYNTKDTSVASRRENTIFSPLSIGVALSMVLLGSSGSTFNEVSRVLGLEAGVDISQNSEVVHQMFGLLLNTVNYRVEEGKGPRVSSASGIFVQEGFPIRPEFRAISENAYKSEVINLDFRKKGIEAMNTINNWVKQRTMEKISSILSSVPSPLTNVILASALYFNGEWNQHFINQATRRRPFFIEPNESVEVDIMYNGGFFPFYEDKSLGVKMVQLPYKGLEMSMYVLLPKAEGATALRNFSNQLTAEIIEHLISNLKNETTIVGLPRMKLSSSLSLKRALQNLGLHSLFDQNSADLSILSSGYGSQPAIAGTVLSQALPQPLPQIANPLKSMNSYNDYLIFSRLGQGDNGAPGGVRENFFRYDDKQSGVTVEQWGTGFQIRKIRRVRRDTVDGRDDDASRLTYVAEKNNDGLRRGDDSSTKFVSLQENKYRFRNVDKQKRANRKRRQVTRPMDQSFLRFIQSLNFPSYGLDELRNNAQLTNPGLFADDVLHKVEMDVTERGTEAAAATAVTLQRDGNQKRLMANRPFLFFIRHDPTGLILFWGTVNTPTPNFAAVR